MLKHDRKLLGLLSRCFYQTLKQFLRETSPGTKAVPGMIASIQTYGDNLLRFHSHLHCLVTDGLFLPDGSFLPVPAPDPELLMRAFRHGLLKTLLARSLSLIKWLAPPSHSIETRRSRLNVCESNDVNLPFFP